MEVQPEAFWQRLHDLALDIREARRGLERGQPVHDEARKIDSTYEAGMVTAALEAAHEALFEAANWAASYLDDPGAKKVVWENWHSRKDAARG